MSILKFLKNLFGTNNSKPVSLPVEAPTKVEEPVVVVETKEVEKVEPVKTEEVKVEEVKKSEEPKKTAKEIKAKVRKPSNNPNDQQKTAPKNNKEGAGNKPRPNRRRPQKKSE